MTEQALQKLLHTALEAGMQAAASISENYRRDISVEHKKDGSPITEADRSAHNIISEHLKDTGLPMLSEESSDHSWEKRKNWKWFWLVDPLDGTKEYINRNGEFTVNIALIHGSDPVLGVIVAPELNSAWMGITGTGAWFIDDCTLMGNWKDSPIDTFAKPIQDKMANTALRVAASRSHCDEKTMELIRSLGPGVEVVSRGSSLKFCDLAQRQITLYPRYSPTYEWDTAAGHAIVKAAGGEVISLEDRKPLRYNKPNLVNPSFVAFTDSRISDLFFRKSPY